MAVPTPTHTDGRTRNITNVNRDAAPVAIKISVRCRLSEAVNTTASAELTRAVGKENLLLQTYDIFLPPPHQRAAWLVPGNRDIVGSRILQTFYPSLVQHAVPLAVLRATATVFSVPSVVYFTARRTCTNFCDF